MDMPSLTKKPREVGSRGARIEEFKDLRKERDNLQKAVSKNVLELNQNLSILTSQMRRVNRALATASHDTKHLGNGGLSRTFNGLREISTQNRDLYEGVPPRAEDGQFSPEAADLYVAAIDLRAGVKEIQEYMRRGLGAGEKPESVADLDMTNQELSEILDNILANHDVIKDSRKALVEVTSKARDLRVDIDTMQEAEKAKARQRDAAVKYS